MMNLFADDLPGTRAGVQPEPGQSPPPARAPSTADRLDLGDWDVPAPAPRTSRRWLLVAAVAPWIVVAAILATGPRTPGPDATPPAAGAPSTPPGDDPTAPSATPTPDVVEPTGAPSSPGSTPPDIAPPPPTAMTGPAQPTTRGEAVGLAAVVARSWLSTRPEGVAIEGLEPSPGADSRYVEHLLVESIDHPAGGALVVTVRALVLPVEGDAYGPGQQVRLAVPVALDADEARLAGPPWLLAVEDAHLQVPTAAPVDDPDLQLAAAEAVMATGYRDVDLVALERTSGWAWIAHVEGRAPGQDEVGAHAIWLRSEVGRLVVAGAPAPPPAAPPTATPSTPPSSPSPTDTEATP